MGVPASPIRLEQGRLTREERNFVGRTFQALILINFYGND